MIGSCFADITSLNTKFRVAKDSSYSCISIYSGEHHRSIINQQTLNQPQIIQPSQKSFQKTEQGWLLKVDKTIESNKKRGPTSAQARSHKYKGEDLNTALPESKTTSTSFMNNLTQHSQEAAQALADPNIIKQTTAPDRERRHTEMRSNAECQQQPFIPTRSKS